jgi:two-component system sensor histidine kinase KdpD
VAFVFRQNATTAGFAYLLFVLIVAGAWGFVEALIASLAATFAFNYFFLPPIGQFTIADPKNWVALFSFLATSLIASRLSAKAERRTMETLARQQDLEKLYTFSRAILLIGPGEPVPRQLATSLAEMFGFRAVVLYDRRTETMFRAGPDDFEGIEDQLRDAARNGTSYSNSDGTRLIASVRLGSQPIASLALQGRSMPDAVLQGIANLVAIGLERATAQELSHQIEAARQSEQLRTTLIDAMAHEYKTPLTSIKAVTTALLAIPAQTPETRNELLRVADEEADHLRNLIDDSIEMARLDMERIDLQPEDTSLGDLIRETIASMHPEERAIALTEDGECATLALDRRLIRLALRQLLDNARKYSPPETPITIRLGESGGQLAVEVTDRGSGIPAAEQSHVFERFYRSPRVKEQVPGTGLGLSIARGIMRAHKGDLTVASRPGETTFRMLFPVNGQGGAQ